MAAAFNCWTGPRRSASFSRAWTTVWGSFDAQLRIGDGQTEPGGAVGSDQEQHDDRGAPGGRNAPSFEPSNRWPEQNAEENRDGNGHEELTPEVEQEDHPHRCSYEAGGRPRNGGLGVGVRAGHAETYQSPPPPPPPPPPFRLTSVRQFDNYETVSTETGTRHRLAPGQFELIAKALADPRRVGVLEAIADEQCCACQHLRDQFPVSKATISHHIKELVRAGLVEARREVGCRATAPGRRGALEAYAAELLRRVGSDPSSPTPSPRTEVRE